MSHFFYYFYLPFWTEVWYVCWAVFLQNKAFNKQWALFILWRKIYKHVFSEYPLFLADNPSFFFCLSFKFAGFVASQHRHYRMIFKFFSWNQFKKKCFHMYTMYNIYIFCLSRIKEMISAKYRKKETRIQYNTGRHALPGQYLLVHLACLSIIPPGIYKSPLKSMKKSCVGGCED